MKKLLFALLVFTLLCGMSFFIIFDREKSPIHGKLIINGEEVSANAQIHGDFAEIPFTEVLKALGGTIDWINDNEARIVVQDKLFTLKLEDPSFRSEESTINLLMPAPGSSILSCKALSKELMLDNITLKSVMHSIGILADIQYSIDDALVYMTIRE